MGVIRNLRFCLPTPPLTARDGAKNECTNNKAEILQQTILVHIDTSKVEFYLNPSDINYNADSDLSTNIYCKISESKSQEYTSRI